MKKTVALFVSLIFIFTIGCDRNLRSLVNETSVANLPPPNTNYSGAGSASGSVPGYGLGFGHPDNNNEFTYYSGPVFPLSILYGADGITASRNISYDFSGFSATESYSQSDIAITDNYIISNDTESSIAAKILYPFAGTFSNLDRFRPSIAVDGIIMGTELMAGCYSGGLTGMYGSDIAAANLSPIKSWEEYVTLLSDGNYLDRALESADIIDQIVTVYEFRNIWANRGEGVNPTLAADFHLDFDNTTVLAYCFNGLDADIAEGYMQRFVFVPREWDAGYNRSFLIVFGEDIYDLVIQGYKNGSCSEGEELEVLADIVRYETALGDVLMTMLGDFMEFYYSGGVISGEYPRLRGSIDISLVYKATVDLIRDYGILSDAPAFRYRWDTAMGDLYSTFEDMLMMERVFYLSTDIVIPAGGSLDLTVDMLKPGSYSNIAAEPDMGIYGYEMLTQLGSNLIFESLTAGLTGTNRIEIVRQNFGFDLENRVYDVVLDPNIQRYFIEVRHQNA